MPDTLGLIEAAVAAHRLVAEGFLLCAIEPRASRRGGEKRREPTQLRAADGHVNDIVADLILD